MSLLIGDLAPDFSLPNQFGEDVTLSQFRGAKPVKARREFIGGSVVLTVR